MTAAGSFQIVKSEQTVEEIQPAPNLEKGAKAPAFAVKTTSGKDVKFPEDFKGKVVMLDFWATWCGPCLASVPHNNELQKKYADKGVVFIAICPPNGGEKMEATVKKHEMKYATALDAGKGDTFSNYKGDSYPDYYIIYRKGNLRWGDVVNDDVEKAINILIAEKD